MSTTCQKVKEELAHYRTNRRCCQLAELSALLHLEGTYGIRGSEGHMVVAESSGAATVRKIFTLLHQLFEVETPLIKVERSVPRRHSVYHLEIPEQPGFYQVLNELGVLDRSLSPEPAIPPRLTRRDCCAAAALRGSFLGGGYISGPKGQADFEICFASREAAQSFRELFERKGLRARMRKRRNQWVLYMKGQRQISEFLAVSGAHSAHLEWESQKVLAGTRNTVNRLVNCDAANARRLAAASLRQREIIARLQELGLLEGSSAELAQIAVLRNEHPQASLAELGKLADPPVTKAVVQGRLRRLEAMLERQVD